MKNDKEMLFDDNETREDLLITDMTDEKYMVQDDTAEQWKKENPEEFLELERRFQELHKND